MEVAVVLLALLAGLVLFHLGRMIGRGDARNEPDWLLSHTMPSDRKSVRWGPRHDKIVAWAGELGDRHGRIAARIIGPLTPSFWRGFFEALRARR